MNQLEWISPTLQLVKYFIKVTKKEEHWITWELRSNDSWDMDGTYNESNSHLILIGSTKWYGCSDFHFSEDGESHFCELYQWKDFSQALEWCYRTVYEMIDAKDGDLE